ncbi:hypothetical protein MMC31_001945 [Peltigera leucophlebia]|nr:hypothetical protein [Peltigera leucophlebia]
MASKSMPSAKKKAKVPSTTQKTPRKQASSSALVEATPPKRPKLKINPPKNVSTVSAILSLAITEAPSAIPPKRVIRQVSRVATQDLLPEELLETQKGLPDEFSHLPTTPKEQTPESSNYRFSST